jgi:hypothetical protein
MPVSPLSPSKSYSPYDRTKSYSPGSSLYDEKDEKKIIAGKKHHSKAPAVNKPKLTPHADDADLSSYKRPAVSKETSMLLRTVFGLGVLFAIIGVFLWLFFYRCITCAESKKPD